MSEPTQTLPPDVYRVAQERFDAIPGSPWVYWIGDAIRSLFETCPQLDQIAKPVVGLQTGANARFVRYWWEVGWQRIDRDCKNREEALQRGMRWFPYMKGGTYRKWYGNQDFVVNWHLDGHEIRNLYTIGNRLASRPQNTDYYFREGITWTDLGASGFSARVNPGGFIFDVSGSCAFPAIDSRIPALLATMNAKVSGYLLSLLNPTMHFQVGDLARLPIPSDSLSSANVLLGRCILLGMLPELGDECSYDFCSPQGWDRGPIELAHVDSMLAELERTIDDKVYRAYGLGGDDRMAVEDELSRESSTNADNDDTESSDYTEDSVVEARITRPEIAVRWISYAIGIALGRFCPGAGNIPGSSVYRRANFAVGSLPPPDQEVYDELVGLPDQFVYIDEDGGRHVFYREIEEALRELAVLDGITVFDKGHPSDLPALVEQALVLMLGENAAQEVIQERAAGDLRKFLERDFFTKWHMRWYRKRPVYWPLQSAKRSYGFVLFHEKIDKYTLYVLQRDYLDHKINGLRLELQDLEAQRDGRSGRELRQLERNIDDTQKLLDEVSEFARTMARITQEGYEPEENWIDDGVILRMAPLWELIPIWKAEPKKYWERLQKGDYDWSHIAMNYWPDRVREACKTNKSFAIAHGHEEWYEGQ